MRPTVNVAFSCIRDKILPSVFVMLFKVHAFVQSTCLKVEKQ